MCYFREVFPTFQLDMGILLIVRTGLKQFFLPKLTKRYLFRVFFVALFFFLILKFVFLPIRIHGKSMEPTYRDGGFNLCFKLKYVFSKPKIKDVVAIRLAGERVLLLKRVVALQGDTVEFQDGVLIVNGKKIDEPYRVFYSDWNLAPRTVDKGNVYVVGDNRGVPIHVHQFGQTSAKRIIGGPLW
jgi:signal peptidase I